MYIPIESMPGIRVFGHHNEGRGRPSLSNEEREFRKKVGLMLRKIRREADKTQLEVALAVGLRSPAAICQLESGKWYNSQIVEKIVRFLLK